MKNKQLHFSDISLKCMMQRLLKDLWMVIASALIFSMLASLLLTWTHTDLYRASVSYSVTSRRTSYTSSSNLNAAKEASAVLAQMAESNVVLDSLRAEPGLQDFNGTISATQVENTNFITITVTDDSPASALLAIQALTDIFPTFTSYLSDSVLQIIRNPAVTSAPINKVDVTNSSIKAGFLGGAAMAVLLCWLYLQQETIQTRSGARHLLDAHIIATVRHEGRKRGIKGLFTKSSKPVHIFSPATSFAFSEQINTICARMEQESASKGSRVFIVTSVGENEGKTTIAGNVAAALALRDKRVALLDCDLRNPSLNKFFDGKYTAPLPLNKLLSQPLTKDTLLQCMQHYDRLGLYMLFPLAADRRCAELLAGETMDNLLQQLRIFDYVILDTPPMGLFADAEVLAEKVDASLLVVRQDNTPASDINDTIGILRGSGSAFLGCVLNGMTVSITEGHGYGYGYGYGRYDHYGYGSQHGTESGKKSSRKSTTRKGG